MPARAIWKGVICFSDLRVPVKLYAAVEDRNIHFNLLHDQDLVRLQQRMVNSQTGEVVPAEQRRKGYEFERGCFVLLSEEELESLEPKETRDIEVVQFVDPALINHQWYLRPYWLGPDGDNDDYFALATALAESGQEGVAHWVMRKKQYQGALRAQQGYLLLITLRSSPEIISADRLEPPQGRPLDPRERKMAEQLVAALQADFDPDDFQDEHRRRVMQLIEAKRRGDELDVQEYEPSEESDSLVGSLEASLQAVR